MKDGPCSRDSHKTSPISDSRRELVAAHVPTAVVAMVINSVRTQGTPKPPILTGSIAIYLGTHGQDDRGHRGRIEDERSIVMPRKLVITV